MFIVVFVMAIVGLLAINFFRMSREAQSNAHRFQTSEVARQLAAAAADEAFMYIHDRTGDVSSALFKKLCARESSIDMSSKGFENRDSIGEDIPIELTKKVAPDHLSVSAKARITDFRNVDSSGLGTYYGKEGVGTLEIQVTVKPKSAFQKGTCTIIRHHDYKVVAVVSARNNNEQRTGYANSYALDYVLFLRDGAAEFESTRGLSLNPSDKRVITISQGDESNPEKFGKVYFGTKTNTSSDNMVFLNIDSSRESLLPGDKQRNLFLVDGPTIDQIIPGFQSSLSSQANKDAKDAGAKSGSASMSNHEGQFSFSKEPITDEHLSKTENMSDYRDYIMYMQSFANNASQMSAEYYEPGIIIKPESSLDKIIEGDVRQRFFHFGRFFVDLSKASVNVRVRYKRGFRTKTKSETAAVASDMSTVEKSANNFMPCYDPAVEDEFRAAMGITGSKFLVYDVIKSNIDATPDSVSRIDLRYPYRKGLTDGSFQKPNTVIQPKLYKHREVSAVSDPLTAGVPFAHVNLWARRELTNAHLTELGIYNSETRKLKLRGVIQMSEALTLGKDGEVEFEGSGVIIAPGITIKNALKPKSGTNSVCVLVTRGFPITIDTNKRVEAALISMGTSHIGGYIRALKPLDLYGCIAADKMNLGQWLQNAQHKITYNPLLKRNEDLYQINVSRWVTFERVLEQEE